MKAVSLKKTFGLVFPGFFLSILAFQSLNHSYTVMLPSFGGHSFTRIRCGGLGAKVDFIMIRFLMMVSFVVSIVCLYRELYIEHYNIGKFLMIKIFFFLSILILLCSNRGLTLIIGWDWLGVSSIFLIIFYPNKITLFNSVLTIIFNRGGDIILVSILCYVIFFSGSFRAFSLRGNLAILLPVLLLCCSLTKRAQFPLSSWLPAAMSAPTPISAMVHSSTLVTAGLYIVSNLCGISYALPISFSFFLLSALSFLSGGLIANLEFDFKKVVAFSTIRQISMIFLFFYRGFLILGVMHMILHAMFKTLLFCCCGTIFLYNFSDQLFKTRRLKNSKILTSFFFFRIFRMTGLIFSGSFFTKDKILESLFLLGTSDRFLFLFTGGLATLFYCCRLIDYTFNFVRPSLIKLNNLFFYFKYFSILTLLGGTILILLAVCLSSGSCRFLEVAFFSFFFFFLATLNLNFLNLKNIILLTLDIFLIKTMRFSAFSHITKGKNLYFSDSFIFKPTSFLPQATPKRYESVGWTFLFCGFLIFIKSAF